jgi:pimeloyl-ACP methyl ester carboxylesterase
MDRVRKFREEHPLTRVMIHGREWEYIAAGKGERALLLLPGALAVADSTWITLPHFEDRFRVIAPTYPPVSTMSELVDGIAGILDREGIRTAAVSGGSYGGLVAQVFVRRYPERTERLILSHTLLPDPSRAGALKRGLRVVGWLPEGLVRWIFRKRIAGLLPPRPETDEFRAYTMEVAAKTTKAGLLALYERAADFLVSFRFRPDDLDGWPGKILILLSDDDPATPEAAREALKAMYPRAEVHVFSGGGHATALLQPERYFEVIDRFLA